MKPESSIVLTGELLDLVLRLLDIARQEMSRNQDVAVRSLFRVSSLLRAQQDALEASIPEHPGALPIWKRRLVLLYIDGNLSRSIMLDDLAEVAGLSSSYFSRSFKLAFQISPSAFVNRRRIVRSMQMMLETDEPLSQIAIACGLSDQAHLSRLFKKTHGMPPARWRRIKRENLAASGKGKEVRVA